ITPFTGTEAGAIEHAVSLSEERFYVTDTRRALAGAKLAMLLANAGGVKGKLTEIAAQLVGSKTRMVELAKSVLDHGMPELLQAVPEDTVSVSDAARVTKLPGSAQLGAIAAVRSGKAKTLAAAVEPLLPENWNGEDRIPGQRPNGTPSFNDSALSEASA